MLARKTKVNTSNFVESGRFLKGVHVSLVLD